jgi:hypothetical protein
MRFDIPGALGGNAEERAAKFNQMILTAKHSAQCGFYEEIRWRKITENSFHHREAVWKV